MSLFFRFRNTAISLQMLFSIFLGCFMLIYPNLNSIKAAINIKNDYSPLDLDLIYHSHAGGCFDLFAPFIAVLPTSVTLCDEINNGFSNTILLRTSRKKYYLEHITISGLAGGIALSFPTAFVSVFFVLVGQPFYPKNEIINIGVLTSVFQNTIFEHIQSWRGGIGVLIILTIFSFLFGAIWSTISLCIGALSKKRFLAISAPFAIYFLLFLLCYRIPSLLIISPVNLLMPDLSTIPSIQFVFTYLGIFYMSIVVLCFYSMKRGLSNV